MPAIPAPQLSWLSQRSQLSQIAELAQALPARVRHAPLTRIFPSSCSPSLLRFERGERGALGILHTCC